MKGDTGQLVALTDVKHRDRVAFLQQLLHQVPAQETRAPDDRAPLVALQDAHGAVRPLQHVAIVSTELFCLSRNSPV